MQYWIEIKWKTLKLFPYYQFQKSIPYLAFMGKLWGVVSESFEEEIMRYQEGTVYDTENSLIQIIFLPFFIIFYQVHDTENSQYNLNIFIMIYVCDVGHMTMKYQLFLSI